MDEDITLPDPLTYVIPDDLCRRSGLAATWIKGNDFAVFPFHPKTMGTKDSKSLYAPCDPKIFMIRQQIMLFHPILRKLINESNGTFLSLQNMVNKLTYGDSRPELLKFSRQYRAIIRACLENLRDSAESTVDDQEKDLLNNYITIFYCIECVWHLCEILYVDTIPGDVILPQVLNWVRLHFPNHEMAANEILEACEQGSDERSDYWSTVVGMVLQGRIDIVRALLKLHSNGASNHFKTADNVLRTLPSYSVYGNISTNEFTVNWKHWQIDCEAKINAGSFANEPKLEHIMKLVTGQRSALEEARAECTCWRDLLGAWLLYVSPVSKKGDLGMVARSCAAVKAPGQSMQPPTRLDLILLALMEDDLHTVLHEIQQMSDNGWFATHITDLLLHSGKLNIVDDYQTNVTGILRNSLVLDYGSLLAGHHSLWSVGFSYLSQCPNRFSDEEGDEGMHRTALLMARLPLGSEYRIMKILHEAKRYNLLSVAESICQRQAMLLWKKGRAGAALGWALRARAAPLAARLADAALRQYTITGKLSDADLVGTLGPDMMLSDRLVFLAKYCEFHRLYRASQFKEAANLLISLLASKITPNYFWSTLLFDTLPLLECDEIVLSTNDTLEIMHCVEERIANDVGERLDLLRLALSRNLARTLLVTDKEFAQN